MNLKLGKSFPVLKFKPNILESMPIDFSEQAERTWQINAPIRSFVDIIRLDYLLGRCIRETKSLISEYIQSIQTANISRFFATKEQLILSLERVVDIIDKLDLENIEKDITELFRSSNGLYALARYTWSADLLQVIAKIKTSFESKGQNQDDADIMVYFRRANVYQEQIEQIMQKEAKIVLKEFVQEMYIIPEQWGCKLMKKNSLDFSEEVIEIINIEDTNEAKLKKLLYKFVARECDEAAQFKSIARVLFYLELEQTFYPYISMLKSIMLNNASGLFNGDYETWSVVYDVSLKICSRKSARKGKQPIQIDQIIEHPIEDAEFTTFLQKCTLANVSMGTINFYFKNCPKAAQESLRGVVMRKIKCSLQSNCFKEYEDIIEYLQTEAQPPEKQEIIELIKSSWMRILDSGLTANQWELANKNIPDLIELLVKKPEYYYSVVNEKMLRKMICILDLNSKATQTSKQNYVSLLIYSFINTLLIQSYQQEFDFGESGLRYQNFTSLVSQVILSLKNKHQLQVHEDGVSIVAGWENLPKKQPDSSGSEGQEEQIQSNEHRNEQFDFSQQVATLMLTSGRDCDFKLEQYLKSEARREQIAGHVTKMFKDLSRCLAEQRQQIEKFLEAKSRKKFSLEEKWYIKSFLSIKGFKDKLLHQNILNLAMKINPIICFTEMSSIALDFLTFTTPTMVDDPLPMGSEREHASMQPFDICDIISGEEPIECMKLIFKKLPDFEESMLQYECLEKMPLPLLKHLGDCFSSRTQLVEWVVEMEDELTMWMIDTFGEFRKFLFYVELMTKVFNKLNEKSQKGIKQIKVIYASMEKTCHRIWKTVRDRVVSSEIYQLCIENQNFESNLREINRNSTEIEKEAYEYYQITFNKLIKAVRLPFIDSILSRSNYITKTCHDLICSVAKVLNPNGFPLQYRKLFDPLEMLSIEPTNSSNPYFKTTYELVGQVVKFLAMIQFTCCLEQDNDASNRDPNQQWLCSWRKNCRYLTQNLLLKVEHYTKKVSEGSQNEKKIKNLWVNVFLVHLKAEITKIHLPFLMKDPLKNPVDNPKTYQIQLQQTFSIFSMLCQIIQSISQGEEQHLMAFLQIFQNFDTGSNNKNPHVHSKVSEYLFKAIQSLLELVFKGIRVRSYHFYKFIRSYLRLTKEKQSCMFFNSVIAVYVQNLMVQILPQFTLPESVLEFCDQNMNTGLRPKPNSMRASSNKEMMINEGNLKKNASKNRFSKFVRFEPKFQSVAEKVCAISMFVNLFCRLNFKTLTQGIQRIWHSEKMRLIYVEYLQKMTKLLSKQEQADQKLYDIINVDCFGNLSIILRSALGKSQGETEYCHKMIYQLLRLIQEVRSSKIRQQVKNSLAIPVKKILAEIRSCSTSIETIDFIGLTIQQLDMFRSLPSDCPKDRNCQQILDMVVTCYNMKLARGIRSNVHLNNLLYITKDSDLKLRVLEQNLGTLQRRMSRKDIRALMQKYEKTSDPGRIKQKRSSSRKDKTEGESSRWEQAGENWVEMSKRCEQLVIQIIQNFTSSYANTFKEGNKQSIQPLFNNLKILSLVAINNPEIVSYLVKQKHSTTNLTVYDVMMDSATVCLPIFVELYMIFIKTNFGFSQLIRNGETLVLPNNLRIQLQIKSDLLHLLQSLISCGNSKLHNLVKCLSFLTVSCSSQTKPHFRIYKFGKINNRAYAQFETESENKQNQQLARILKSGIDRLTQRSQPSINSIFLSILNLYEEVLKRLLKDSDESWMKLNLDIELANPNILQSPVVGHCAEEQIKQEGMRELTTVFTLSEDTCCQSCSFTGNDFNQEVVSDQAYGVLYSLSVRNTECVQSVILSAMTNYSDNHTVWEGVEDQDDDTLMNYPMQASSGVEASRSRFYEQQHEETEVPMQIGWRGEAPSEDAIAEDGIIEDDGIVEEDFLVANQLKQCISQTSLQFLSQHSVKCLDDCLTLEINTQYNKEHLLSLYQDSVVNPEAKKLLVMAMGVATVMELEKFINNQAVDEEIEMLAVRELWGRGVVPSATSICKNSRYYGDLIAPCKNIGQSLNLHINEAVAYKKMYQCYRENTKTNSTLAYIPVIPLNYIEGIMLSYFLQSCQQSNTKYGGGQESSELRGEELSKNQSLWKILKKLSLQPQNMKAIMTICLKYLGLCDSELSEEITKVMGSCVIDCNSLRRCIIDDVLSGCVKDKVGLRLLFTACWSPTYGIRIQPEHSQEAQTVTILEFILKQHYFIDQIVSSHKKKGKRSQSSANSFVRALREYLESCDEFKAHSKIETNINKEVTTYPYYQLQESLKISEQIIVKIVDRLFSAKAIMTEAKSESEEPSPLEQLFIILVYLDPNCFQYYFKAALEKMWQRLSEIIKKQHKILGAFQSSWSNQQVGIEMEKEEKYWNLRQSKKSTQDFQQHLQYFRDLLADISLNLLPKFKKLRFNYHCGQAYREMKLEIQILREKLLTCGSVDGLLQLDKKQKQLENWKLEQSNQIISQEIIPLVDHSSCDFMKVLVQAEDFISDFLETFVLKQQKEKIVIFNSCAKLYQILLAFDILTHGEKVTYHSMSNLKTAPAIDSLKNVGRKTSQIFNRGSARLSIKPYLPGVQNLLRKIGPSCTFITNYLGYEEPIRQLHTKYSHVDKRLKILWTNRNSQSKAEREKIIECRRTHIIQDTLSSIDEEFIDLPVKIKFEGEIGIDYGGVTQEWITLFIKQIVRPELGLFCLSANKLTFQPNPNSHIIPNHLRYFRKIGVLVGKAMKQNWLLQINLAKSFLKHLLGATLYVEDLEDIDPDTAKSLKWILENDIGNGEDLGLNFTFQVHLLGKTSTIELIPDGANVAVQESNKKSYVKMLANMKMTHQIKEQSKAFMAGLESVIPYSTLSLFSYKQISLYLSGMPTIDIKEMQEHAKYENLTAEAQEITWFWSIVGEWRQEQLGNLLFFLTGSYRVPYGGFRQHPIGFNKMPSCIDYLPVAHTCFSIIDLSAYSSREKMAKLLRKSIKQGKGFSVS